jgi:hypothetical protein
MVQENTVGNNDLGNLQKYCDAGIKMIGVYENGSQIASGKDLEDAYTCNPEIIRELMFGKDPRTKGQKITRFYFKPSHHGLLCIDIDIKNGKDGLIEFYTFCKRNGKSKQQLQKELQDLPNSFPCYTTTANSGYHLYFKHTWTEKQQQGRKTYSLCSGVEVTHLLTTAGSFKDGKPYILCGNISAAPVLPKFIEAAIFNTETIKESKEKKSYSIKSKKDWGKPSWQQIIDWTEKDNSSEIAAGRNCHATYLAIHAKTHGYTEYETLSELCNDSKINSLPEKEIETIVKSIYKKK